MTLITLIKLRQQDAKVAVGRLDALRREEEQRGIRFLGIYLTQGRYDAVAVVDAPEIEDAFKGSIAKQELIATETLVWVATVKHSD